MRATHNSILAVDIGTLILSGKIVAVWVDVGGVMGITTLFDFTKIKIIDKHKMVPKTTVAMFHWVNIDYDIFMK